MSRNSAYLLLLSVVILLVIGLVMLFSASAYAQDSRGDVYFFLRRQSVWLGIGFTLGLAATFIDYRLWFKTSWLFYAVTIVLLALCFVPGIGMRINGSWRWVHFGPVGFQPSELAKYTSVVCLARWFSTFESRTREFLVGFIAPMIITGILMALIVREEDLGTTMLLGIVMVGMMFIAGTKLIYLSGIAVGIAGGIYILASHMGNRMARMTAFLDLEKYKDSFGLQQWEALKAFASGGLTGVGLGDSREKMRYLPYAHTDFIFPIVGEELGLRVTLLVVFAFLVFGCSGFLIARQARDRFGLLLGFGLIATLICQAMVNIGVTTALMPNKGMPLPFISAGGSNLCLCLFFVGILLNIYRNGVETGHEETSQKDALRMGRRVTPRL